MQDFIQSLSDIDWPALSQNRTYFPSPHVWQDEVLYFLFVDRFSDAKEFGGFADNQDAPLDAATADRTTPPFNRSQDEGTAERAPWFEAGRSWCGGTLAGLQDKLGYLRRMGVTAIWLSPIFKQVTESHDYHGYGIQHFLEVDPHFGTRAELKDLVEEAHHQGIRVILDIILNHAGNVFAYPNNVPYFYANGQQFDVQGFRRHINDAGTVPFGPIDPSTFPNNWQDIAIWPDEFQIPENWTRQGEIRNWDNFPEYIDGDFLSLKDLTHGTAPDDASRAWDIAHRIANFRSTATLQYLADVYKFWIAYADIDGYRIDTVKHMEPGAVRVFSNIIHEFAQSLGKENFYLIGEITGGRAHAVNLINTTGLDAALGINDIPEQLEFMAKGYRSPGNPDTDGQEGYFDLFRNSLLDNKNSHQWFGEHVVTLFDDHDQVGTRHKFRFSGDHPDSEQLLPVVLGLNLMTAGIPCIYYGTEQAFNGADEREDNDSFSDVFLRECMFGGPFGSYQSINRHFFNEQHPIYRFLADITALRNAHIALRRGRQYLRQLSESGSEGDFHYPQPLGGELRWLIAWSRLFAGKEFLCAVNTNIQQELTLWATVDQSLNNPGAMWRCLYSTDKNQIDQETAVEARNGSAIRITVPAGGFAVYASQET